MQLAVEEDRASPHSPIVDCQEVVQVFVNVVGKVSCGLASHAWNRRGGCAAALLDQARVRSSDSISADHLAFLLQFGRVDDSRQMLQLLVHTLRFLDKLGLDWFYYDRLLALLHPLLGDLDWPILRAVPPRATETVPCSPSIRVVSHFEQNGRLVLVFSDWRDGLI